MGALMNIPWALLMLILAPLGLFGAFGLVVLALKIIAIVQKAGEPRTEDQRGDYHLEQSREIGKDE